MPSVVPSTICSRAWATWPSRCATTAAPATARTPRRSRIARRRARIAIRWAGPDGNYGDSVDNGTDKVPLEIDRQKSREILDELRRRAGEMQRPKEELDYIDRLLKTY